ncbi:ribonuclease domain-containing protein [Streptomyces sp. NRRL WC-3618]|uniref:ribonuclease domain-containing protein n=1 Tax=Streptomyces sp. NRRL WC-3618 TaxID=1519490 RepID=UPI000A97BAF3|nr:ribonuclease domain-containing protein [Streptomyces sp. NRRL WC-3618]
MLSTDQTSAPSAALQKKPRPRRLGRALAVAGMAFALLGGTIGTASATPPQTVYCPQTCWQQQVPAGANINPGMWQDANSSAAFWANYNIDWNHSTFGWRDLSPQWGHGWPAQAYGGTWYAYFEPNYSADRFIYYGGIFNDYNGTLTRQERARGASPNQAWSTLPNNTRLSPYVEYDIHMYSHTNPSGGRGQHRLVRNPNTGNVYATFDHYNTFYFLGRF